MYGEPSRDVLTIPTPFMGVSCKTSPLIPASMEPGPLAPKLPAAPKTAPLTFAGTMSYPPLYDSLVDEDTGSGDKQKKYALLLPKYVCYAEGDLAIRYSCMYLQLVKQLLFCQTLPELREVGADRCSGRERPCWAPSVLHRAHR